MLISLLPDHRPKRNELIGTPSDVALLRYVEMVASVEGIRQRYQVKFCLKSSKKQ